MGMIWKIGMAVFPFEKLLREPPILFTSKMTADVNPCFPLPERLTSQELPRAHPQTAGVPRRQASSSVVAELRDWSPPALLNQVLSSLPRGSGESPRVEAGTLPTTLPASKGCGVSSLSAQAKFVADKLSSCQKLSQKTKMPGSESH